LVYEHPSGLPDEYRFTYSVRDGDSIKDLRISNKFGSVLWPGTVSVDGVDFSEGPTIAESQLQLWEEDGINETCVVTMKLPVTKELPG
jgi:hypothetical protein